MYNFHLFSQAYFLLNIAYERDFLDISLPRREIVQQKDAKAINEDFRTLHRKNFKMSSIITFAVFFHFQMIFTIPAVCTDGCNRLSFGFRTGRSLLRGSSCWFRTGRSLLRGSSCWFRTVRARRTRRSHTTLPSSNTGRNNILFSPASLREGEYIWSTANIF